MDTLALILLIIGGLNWGSIGLFEFDFIGTIFGGTDSIVSRIIFVIVGLAAVWAISFLFRENSVLRRRDRD